MLVAHHPPDQPTDWTSGQSGASSKSRVGKGQTDKEVRALTLGVVGREHSAGGAGRRPPTMVGVMVVG